jgi:hypothetical protein
MILTKENQRQCWFSLTNIFNNVFGVSENVKAEL